MSMMFYNFQFSYQQIITLRMLISNILKKLLQMNHMDIISHKILIFYLQNRLQGSQIHIPRPSSYYKYKSDLDYEQNFNQGMSIHNYLKGYPHNRMVLQKSIFERNVKFNYRQNNHLNMKIYMSLVYQKTIHQQICNFNIVKHTDKWPRIQITTIERDKYRHKSLSYYQQNMKKSNRRHKPRDQDHQT